MADFDMDAAADSVAQGLGLDLPAEDPPIEGETPEIPPVVAETPEVAAPVTRQPPSSWAKEYHEPWAKVDPKVQEYIEKREQQMLDGLGQYKDHAGFGKTIREALTPYMPTIEAMGLDAPRAFAVLFSAHQRLTNGSPEQRLAAYQQLGQNLGFSQPKEGEDPRIPAAMQRLERMENALTQREQEQLTEHKAKVADEVTAFADAKDEKGAAKHPYFNDVADEIIAFIANGADLNAAYEKAVYANPVTRAKEIARLNTEHEAKLRENARLDALKARGAKSANVRSRDTSRTPTEPLGKMEDTLKETFDAIQSRDIH